MQGQVSKHGDTALIYCSQWHGLEMVDFLLSQGAELNTRNNQGKSSLMYASSLGGLDVVECLLRHGADPLYRMGGTGERERWIV